MKPHERVIEERRQQERRASRAAVAYHAYGEVVGFKNHEGRQMPMWSELPERIRLAWIAAADAARNACV